MDAGGRDQAVGGVVGGEDEGRRAEPDRRGTNTNVIAGAATDAGGDLVAGGDPEACSAMDGTRL